MKDFKNLTDIELVQEFAHRQEPKAFDVIFNRYFTDTYRFIYSRVGDRTSAEDICSETFITLLSTLSAFNSTNLKSFIIGIAYNKIRHTWRNVKTEEYFDEEIAAVDEDEDQNEDELLSTIDKTLLDNILNELPENYRSILVERNINNKSIAELSEETNMTANNLRVLYHRALQKAIKISKKYTNEKH